jgi:ABC-type sugar transport system permease subunit
MTSVALDQAVAVQRRRRLSLASRWVPFLFLVPVAAELVVFRYIPTASALYHSLTNWDGLRRDKFVGLANFVDLFSDNVFRAAFVNMLEYTAIRTAFVLLFAFTAAELIFSLRNERLRMFWKIAFVIPLIVPRSVVYLMWAFIFDPQVGLVNELLTLVGLGGLQQPWLGQSSTSLASLAFIGFPFVSSLAFLIFVASLEGLPRDIIETAALEGCSVFKRILNVDLPMLRGGFIFVAVLLILEGIQTTEPQIILTRGGPGTSTELPAYYLYRTAFDYSKFGQACAVGVVMLGVGLIFTIVSIWLRYRSAYDVD